MAGILKLDPLSETDEQRELELELDFLAELTLEERFALMFEKSRLMRELLDRHGHRRPAEPPHGSVVVVRGSHRG